MVTVAINKSHPNTPGIDSDYRIGISDGTNNNLQFLVDIDDYGGSSPCYTVNGSHDERRVSLGTEVPATFKLLFVPFYKYGSCETVQEGGYINTGTFAAQIDTSKPLFLRMFRSDAS